MSYSDGLSFFIHGTATQGEDSPADIVDFYTPVPIDVEMVGVRVTENFDVSGANAAIMSVDVSSTDAESDRAEKLTMTLPKATGAGADLGDYVYSTANTIPFKVPAGGHVTFEHKQAASDSGGAYVPFMIYRVSGLTKDTALALDKAS